MLKTAYFYGILGIMIKKTIAVLTTTVDFEQIKRGLAAPLLDAGTTLDAELTKAEPSFLFRASLSMKTRQKCV